MSRHKSRIASDGAADASLTEKKKARHRLVGAVALCLVAAIVVPLMLESEPRNAARNLPLTMASDPAPPSGEPVWTEGQPSGEVPAVPGSQALDRLVMLEERVPPAPPPAPPSSPTRESVFSSGASRGNGERAAPAPSAAPQQPAQRPAAGPSAAAPAGRPPETIRPPVPGRQPAPAPAERPDVLARLIDQVDAAKPGAARPERARRFLVQVGAYSNVKSARLASDRVSKAGMTAYHETVKTANGDWIRVRIGPFESREEAEQAQKALKRAGVTAALIAL